MRGHPEDLTKAVRAAAYKVVDEILSREIPAVVLKHHASTVEYTLQEKDQIIERANHILANLREDAENLWKEG